MATVADVPEDYAERPVEAWPGRYERLRVLCLDPYDLALTKLGRNSQKDRDDVRHLARGVPLDLAELRRRYEQELRPYLGRPEREDLTLQLWIDAMTEERAGGGPRAGCPQRARARKAGPHRL